MITTNMDILKNENNPMIVFLNKDLLIFKKCWIEIYIPHMT